MKVLLGVLIWRPTYQLILDALMEANPDLEVDLALTNDTGGPLSLTPETVSYFEKITVFSGASDFFQHCPELDSPQIRKLLKSFKTVAFWQNMLMLYGKARGYDALLIWEDDQFPIRNGSSNYFDPQIAALKRNPRLHGASTKRVGYLHRVPPLVHQWYPRHVLENLEEALGICNEIVFPGLFSNHAGALIPEKSISPYGGVEFFEGKPFIYAGSMAVNLQNHPACFYTIPDLPGQSFSRGNDVFFSLGHDKILAVAEVDQRYIHAPWFQPTDENPFYNHVRGNRQEFLTLIQGWLSYAPLLLRLTTPDWEKRLKIVKDMLANMEPHIPGLVSVFDAFVIRVEYDRSRFLRTREHWRRTCSLLASHKLAYEV